MTNSCATVKRGFIKTQTVNNTLYILEIMNRFVFWDALRRVEKGQRLPHLGSPCIKIFYELYDQWRLRREGAFMCNFHVGFWYLLSFP